MHRARRFQTNQPGNPENNGARTFGFYRRAETAGNDRIATARIVIFQIRHLDNPPGAAADGKASVAFRCGKR